MLSSAFLSTVLCVALAQVAQGQTTANPYGQCGGQGWSGPSQCPSGYTCTVSNQWYSQCLPGGPTSLPPVITPTPTIPSAPVPTPTAGPAPSVTPTLIPNHSFIRAVSPPNYRKYLRSQIWNAASDAVVGEPIEAALFRVENGQLIQNANGTSLYAVLEPRADSSVMKLKMSWTTSPAASGRFVFSGDTLEWSNPSISRPQNNAWLVCPDARGNKIVYVNLGPYSYNTPAGCADQTIHAYTGPSAVP
ncbi:hypothetical protein FA15DRAFT_752559 [Coprinopsis marcescibilis]|uniref:CBM1 domain-containing protein n=1 Tax=Coprinopsis marcescibilis TaxID=230819 RepID=A0A5C3L9I5_COPMA|nr:hypothetical protein FA15DRAFT_752559 [Coprinopsis marcescibilis]